MSERLTDQEAADRRRKGLIKAAVGLLLPAVVTVGFAVARTSAVDAITHAAVRSSAPVATAPRAHDRAPAPAATAPNTQPQAPAPTTVPVETTPPSGPTTEKVTIPDADLSDGSETETLYATGPAGGQLDVEGTVRESNTDVTDAWLVWKDGQGNTMTPTLSAVDSPGASKVVIQHGHSHQDQAPPMDEQMANENSGGEPVQQGGNAWVMRVGNLQVISVDNPAASAGGSQG